MAKKYKGAPKFAATLAKETEDYLFWTLPVHLLNKKHQMLKIVSTFGALPSSGVGMFEPLFWVVVATFATQLGVLADLSYESWNVPSAQ